MGKQMENSIGKSRNIFMVLLFLLLLTPALSLPPWFSPPDWGKTIILRVAVPLLLLIFLWQFYKNRQGTIQTHLPGIKERNHPAYFVFWLFAAYFFWVFLSLIFSKSFSFSVWGNPFRSDGFANFSLFFVFSLLLIVWTTLKEWKKIIWVSLAAGWAVCSIAVFQQIGLFSPFLVSAKRQMASTLGGPNFMAMYLALLAVFCLNLGISERKKSRKAIYLASFALFSYVIFLSISQAAYLGLGLGVVFSFFFSPSISRKLKIAGVVLCLIAVGAVFLIKSNPDSSLSKNFVFDSLSSWQVDQSRISAWKISLRAMKASPIFGYGPENFQTGFDKFYDPSLPEVDRQVYQYTSWWDRAHNFVFDIAVPSGIPALIFYVLSFAFLLLGLQKAKKGNHKFTAHALQASFIGFLPTIFFGFETFSSKLVFFTFFAYSIRILSDGRETTPPPQKSRLPQKKLLFGTVLIVSMLFIWHGALKPMKINSWINAAKYYSQDKNGDCAKAEKLIQKALEQKSILSAYAGMEYAGILRECENKNPQKTLEYALKGKEAMDKVIEQYPVYTKALILSAGFQTIIISRETDPEKIRRASENLEKTFQKAFELSPLRQELYMEWAKAGLVEKNYEKAKEKAEKCISLNPDLAECHWQSALANAYLGNLEKVDIDLRNAKEKGYNINTVKSLKVRANAFSEAKLYSKAIEIYEILKTTEGDPEFYAILAYLYRENKEYAKARAYALKFLELKPEAKEETELFLRTLQK